MKKYIFITILGLLILSCGSETTDNKKKKVTNHEIIEKDNSVKDNKNPKKEVIIDQEFATFLSKFAKSSLPYKENPKGDEKYKKISLKEQVSYLAKAEKLSAEELEEMQDYTDFYYVSNPLNTDKYHAIIYGRFEMGSVYYFLCTYDNNGKLISNIDFAAYEMMTAGPQSGQEYFTKGLINKNHEIKVTTEEETTVYKITDSGRIVKQ